MSSMATSSKPIDAKPRREPSEDEHMAESAFYGSSVRFEYEAPNAFYSGKAQNSRHGHGFPERAASVRDISVLANLVDYRSNYYEEHRVSEDEIKQRTRHLRWGKASAVSEYYERLNETLDGWREIDEILDSKFPDEVMRRFVDHDESGPKKQRKRPHRKAKPAAQKQQQQQESDGNVSDEEETDEEPRGRSRPLKRSFSAKAINAFSGLWSSQPRADIERGTPGSPRQPLLRKQPPHKTFDLTEEDDEESTDMLATSPSTYGATGQLYDRLRREGRIEQIRRSNSNLALSSATGTSTPDLKANTIRGPTQVENVPGSVASVNGLNKSAVPDKVIESHSQPGSLDRKYTRDRHSRPYASQQEDREALLKAVPGRDKEDALARSVQFAININLAVNILLLAGKAFAVLSSNSVSLIASLVDSALDLVSTIIIFGTSKAIEYRSTKTMYKYPVGKKRLEPLGVVVFSVLMIASFVQVFIESLSRLRVIMRTGGQDPESSADLPLVGVAFMLATVGIKTVMWLLYRRSKSSGVRAVAQDAENDVVFNVASLVFPIVGSRLGWPALDAIGGMVLSVYIIYEWVETLWETVSKLSGAVASATEISRCLYCVIRFNSVRSISAFELFHSGDNLIVEADIVLPHSISLKESHDLGEIITYCTENISSVERSYIHLDYNPKGQAGHLGQRG